MSSDLESHREEENVPEELGPQPQPAVITTTINGKVDLHSMRTPLK